MFCDFPKYKHLKQTIFRGPGGTGSATSDSDTTEFQEFLVQSQAARDAAKAAQTAAELAETNAEAAEAAVAANASAAGVSASSAATSASNAASSASAAATSASNASSSASTASTKASEAASSATAAAGSASTASTQASNAAGSATAAANSASAAATSATNASNSASAANTSATNAASSASSAATQASNAASSATAAQAAQTATEAVYDSFDDRYLGSKASAPTTDNDGNTLLVGAMYFNSTLSQLYVWSGSTWIATSTTNSGDVLGPSSSTDNALVRFDGTTGKLVQNSSATLSDAGDLSVTSATINGSSLTNTSIGNWNTAYGWGNHASAGYLLSSTAASTYQPLDGDLTAIAGLADTAGFLKKTAANTWSLDTSTYLTGNQSISLSGDATGSGATSIAVTLANSGVTAGTYTKVTVDSKGRVTFGAALASADLPTYTGTLASSQVTTALGYTPYNSTNPSGYVTSSGSVASATNATNVTGTTTASVPTEALASGTANNTTYLRGDRTWATISGGVTSFIGQTGAVDPSTAYAIGSVVMGRPANYTNYNPGATLAGSSIVVCSSVTVYNDGQWWQTFINSTYTPATIGSGSWRCISRAYAAGTQGDPGLWMRYA